MKTQLVFALLALSMTGCGRYIETQDLPDRSDVPVQAQPINITIQPPAVTVGGDTINVNVGGDTIDNSNSTVANGGAGGSSSATGGSSSATGGSNSNQISSGNSSATGTGGTGGGASAGNATSNANNSGSSNSTNTSTNSGSASNQANNSTNNSADSSSNVSDSGNSSNTNTNTSSAEVDIDQDYDFNIELDGDADYFKAAKKNKKKAPKKCEDPNPNQNMLCHVYDFNGRSSLATDLATAPHLGSFYMDKFDVTARSWDQGFPKFPASLSSLRENYAVRCFAKLKVTSSGTHTFSVTSDDGMRVLLNNSPVLSDDGLHAPRTASATTTLYTGLYDMEVQWFQGPRTEIAAELKWKTPDNSTLRYIESSDMQKAKKLCK